MIHSITRIILKTGRNMQIHVPINRCSVSWQLVFYYTIFYFSSVDSGRLSIRFFTDCMSAPVLHIKKSLSLSPLCIKCQSDRGTTSSVSVSWFSGSGNLFIRNLVEILIHKKKIWCFGLRVALWSRGIKLILHHSPHKAHFDLIWAGPVAPPFLSALITYATHLKPDIV